VGQLCEIPERLPQTTPIADAAESKLPALANPRLHRHRRPASRCRAARRCPRCVPYGRQADRRVHERAPSRHETPMRLTMPSTARGNAKLCTPPD
jgi:hypothetical protein